MDLFSMEESHKLEDALMNIPDMDDPDKRRGLLKSMPSVVRKHVAFNNNMQTHIKSIVSTTNSMTLADGTRTIVLLLAEAVHEAEGLQVQPDLRALLELALSRAALEGGGVKPESLVRAAAGFANPDMWPARIEAATRAVCQIITPHKIGSGFLVAPGLVMTNAHVVDTVLDQPDALQQVEVWFDVRTDDQGRVVNRGTKYRITPGKPIVSSEEKELDSALLPVEEAAGQPVHPAERLSLAPQDRQITPGQVAFIVQYPGAQKSLSVAVGFVRQINATRISYDTNTDDGSSGSPCFNDRWELVALHRAGHDDPNPTYNLGVPFTAILRHARLRQALGL